MAKRVSDAELRKLLYPGGREKDIYRKLSFPIVKLILPWNIHPDTIQLFRLLFCIAGFGLFFTGNHTLAIIGAVLFQMNILFDTFDGALARHQKLSSVKGEYQDAALDHATSSMLYFGSAAILAYLYSLDAIYLWAGALTIILAQFAAFLRAVYIEYNIPVRESQEKNFFVGLAHQDNSREIATILLLAAIFAIPQAAVPLFLILVISKIFILSVHIYKASKKNPFSMGILLRYFRLLANILLWLANKILGMNTLRLRTKLSSGKKSIIEKSILARLN